VMQAHTQQTRCAVVGVLLIIAVVVYVLWLQHKEQRTLKEASMQEQTQEFCKECAAQRQEENKKQRDVQPLTQLWQYPPFTHIDFSADDDDIEGFSDSVLRTKCSRNESKMKLRKTYFVFRVVHAHRY